MTEADLEQRKNDIYKLISDMMEKVNYLKECRNELVSILEHNYFITPEIIKQLEDLNKKIILIELKIAGFRNTFLSE